jgi:hypothetical protein
MRGWTPEAAAQFSAVFFSQMARATRTGIVSVQSIAPCCIPLPRNSLDATAKFLSNDGMMFSPHVKILFQFPLAGCAALPDRAERDGLPIVQSSAARRVPRMWEASKPMHGGTEFDDDRFRRTSRGLRQIEKPTIAPLDLPLAGGAPNAFEIYCVGRKFAIFPSGNCGLRGSR